MKRIFSVFLLSFLIVSIANAQNYKLSKQQIRQDLEYLANILNEKSSYVYLNGYDFSNDFNAYLSTISDSTSLEDFGLFLTKTLGKIGDRHSSAPPLRGFSLNESLFLPFMYAPINNNVVVLNQNQRNELEILNPKYPYLKNIDGIPINDFLTKIRPEHIEAPEATYFTRSVRDIRDIEKNYQILGKPLPNKVEVTLSDSSFKNDTVLVITPVDRSKRLRPWDEKFERQYILLDDEEYNSSEIIDQLFEIQDDIAYIHIPAMVSKNEAPLLFSRLNSFMKSIRDKSKALIIDVRSNSGGTRDLIYEFAKYLVHPDSVYVINATKQRGPIPITQEHIEGLHDRFLYSYSELNNREQTSVDRFIKSFSAMYELNPEKYSEYYFGLFNGRKLAEPSFYYSNPVYILANEKSFSAASVFVSAFKGIPNIEIIGITTDGSSGNSKWFDLPNSQIFGKISTMVSFQKNGEILDGFGTEPDIKIERDMNQVLWKSDSQLEKLKSIILSNQ